MYSFSCNFFTGKKLGVILDSEFCLTKQIIFFVKNSFYQLQIISKHKPFFFSFKDLEKVIHTFITSCLDYCNSLYLGLPHSSLVHLQMLQNAAASLLTSAKKHPHQCIGSWSILGFNLRFFPLPLKKKKAESISSLPHTL